MLMGLLDVWTHAGRSNRARKKDEWSSTMMHLCYRLTILLPKLPFAHLLITKSSDCVSARTYVRSYKKSELRRRHREESGV
jgi:hypothetical protein